MKNRGFVGAVAFASALAAAACSSSNSATKERSATATGGNDTAEGGSSNIGLTGGTTPSVGGSVALAEGGLVPLTPAQADQFTAAACEGWSTEPEKGPAVLEFQVDSTTSMNDPATPTSNQTKWEAMQAALPQALSALPPEWAVGLAFFSSPTNGRCYQGTQAVPIALNTPAQLTALTQALASQDPNGYTPTEAAYLFALGQLSAYDAKNKYVVLVTDGVPTINSDGCTRGGTGLAITEQEYSHFIATVQTQTTATGVKTFVVGVPGSELLQQATYDPMYELSQLATAGGTAIAGCQASPGTLARDEVNPRGTYCHYDMTETTDFGASLIETIGTIAGKVVSCTYTVPTSTDPNQKVVPDKTNMVYDDGAGQKYLVQQNSNTPCEVGWHFTDASNQTIEICSATCALLQANSRAGLSLTFGCIANQIPT